MRVHSNCRPTFFLYNGWLNKFYIRLKLSGKLKIDARCLECIICDTNLLIRNKNSLLKYTKSVNFASKMSNHLQWFQFDLPGRHLCQKMICFFTAIFLRQKMQNLWCKIIVKKNSGLYVISYYIKRLNRSLRVSLGVLYKLGYFCQSKFCQNVLQFYFTIC